MSVVIKTNAMKYKDPNGNYQCFNAVAQETTEQQLASIENEGQAQISAVQQKGTETLASIPSDYTELQAQVTATSEALAGKVTVQQGSGNAGKALVVGSDGVVTTGEAGISEDVKVALLQCFQKVAWIDVDGKDYYDDLYDALYPSTGLVRITAVFTQGDNVIYPSTPLDDLKAYLVVTGYYSDGVSRVITDYALSGTLEVGTSTITVTKEGNTTTFTVVVSASYWDFEWDSSSGVLPEGMTVSDYDFTTEPGVLFAKTPKLDFGYTGNCKLRIEIKSYSLNSQGERYFNSSNNPQFQIQNAVANTNQYRGIKMVMDSSLGTSSEHGMVAVGINGNNALIPGSNSNEYHMYEVVAENNVYSLTIDGSPVTLTQNTNTTQYIAFTGITTAARDPGFYGAFIKSIKFKRL